MARRIEEIERRVILEPADEWSEEFLAALGAWKEEIERPRSIPISEKRARAD